MTTCNLCVGCEESGVCYAAAHGQPERCGLPIADTLDLGDSHTLLFSSYKGQPRVGASVLHLRPDGTKCEGWIAFRGKAWADSFAPDSIATWEVVQEDPLTISPSILCRACGDHGYVRNGRWERA